MTHVGLEEEVTGFFIWPVVGDGVFLLWVFLDEVHDGFEGAVVADQFQGSVGANFRDGIDVVAAKEDAEVDELAAH